LPIGRNSISKESIMRPPLACIIRGCRALGSCRTRNIQLARWAAERKSLCTNTCGSINSIPCPTVGSDVETKNENVGPLGIEGLGGEDEGGGGGVEGEDGGEGGGGEDGGEGGGSGSGAGQVETVPETPSVRVVGQEQTVATWTVFPLT